jgi:hypothetical protein
LRRIVLLLAACSAADGAPFSHKVHLELKLECAGCHVAAATSTKPDDNLLPLKTACTGCHQDVQIPVPTTTRVVHFSHAQHLKMGNVAPLIAAAIDKKTYLQPPRDIRRHLDTRNACEACHRGLEESDAVSAANMPQMADCLVCHSQIDNPFSCEKCHAKDANLKPANHTADFLDTHTSGKLGLDKTTCAVCHGRRFRCLGCH